MFYNIKNGNNKCSSPSGFIAKQYLIFFLYLRHRNSFLDIYYSTYSCAISFTYSAENSSNCFAVRHRLTAVLYSGLIAVKYMQHLSPSIRLIFPNCFVHIEVTRWEVFFIEQLFSIFVA